MMAPMVTLSTAEASVMGTLILGFVTVVTALIAQRQSRKGAQATAVLTNNANELDKRKVDLDYFKEYRDQMDKRLALLENDIKAEREARVKANERADVSDERADDADRRARLAERRAIRLERRIAQLEDVLREHQIVVPPYEDDDLPPEPPPPEGESLQPDI